MKEKIIATILLISGWCFINYLFHYILIKLDNNESILWTLIPIISFVYGTISICIEIIVNPKNNEVKK